jgi:hypothetical protein
MSEANRTAARKVQDRRSGIIALKLKETSEDLPSFRLNWSYGP